MQFDDISAVVCHTQLVVMSATKSACTLGTTEYVLYMQCQHSLAVQPVIITPYSVLWWFDIRKCHSAIKALLYQTAW